MDSDTATIFRSAFESYITQTDSAVEPSSNHLPYDFEFIWERRWHIEGGEMVEGELRELTSQMNHWHSDLRKWHAWNKVIKEYEGDNAWLLRREFLEARVHQCLLWPSAIRDALTFVGTNSLHQVRLSSEEKYKDFIEGDPAHPDEKRSHLTRRKKEKRLAKIASAWPSSGKFLASLRKINDREYQQETSDYRNRANHAIAPRLGVGLTQTVIREVVQATQMEEQEDGTYKPVPIPGKLSVRYGFGGTSPLDFEEARVSNLHQYLRARDCYCNYVELLKLGIGSIELRTENA